MLLHPHLPEIDIRGKSIGRPYEIASLRIEPERTNERAPCGASCRDAQLANGDDLAVRQPEVERIARCVSVVRLGASRERVNEIVLVHLGLRDAHVSRWNPE